MIYIDQLAVMKASDILLNFKVNVAKSEFQLNITSTEKNVLLTLSVSQNIKNKM